MESLSNDQTFHVNYDKEADVLYISFGQPQKAEGIDIGNGIIVRVLPETDKVVGLTIIKPFELSKRIKNERS
jgi:uncharacterized protein YuzE